MDNTMEDYYKVLQYLRETHIDRQYPYEFTSTDYILNNSDCELVGEHNSDFDNSLKITDISNGDRLTIQLPSQRDYVDIDFFEILFYSEDTITTDDITIGLSNLRNGVVNQVELTKADIYDDGSFINENGYYLFKYRIRNTNTKMQKKNRKIGNVASVNIEFNTDVSEFYLSNIVARVDQFTITLEDLDEQIIMGKNYVANQLLVESFDDIPPQLEFLCWKGAGAYSWLIWWENEGKTMDDGTKQGRNYATRLLEEIDKFIENYKTMTEEEDLSDKVNMKLVGFGEFCGVSSKCKPCKKPKYYKGSRLV